MYYIYYSFEKDKLSYIHLFEGNEVDHEGYTFISKSIFRFSKPKVYMTSVGEKLFIRGRPSSEKVSDLVQIIIVSLFEGTLSRESVVR